ncbi:MAG: hypothetical protein KGI29_06960 [Pseudomonadota bacterium]|nr:hypothetical protein [Pseudomonadota bacterium]MDE3038191.1 hypothetical protein [Pseudomonadota bacterium]
MACPAGRKENPKICFPRSGGDAVEAGVIEGGVAVKVLISCYGTGTMRFVSLSMARGAKSAKRRAMITG